MQIGQSWNSGLFWLIVLVIMILNVSYSPSDLEHSQLTSHKKFELKILKYHVDIVKLRFFELYLCSGLKFVVEAVSIKSHVASRQGECQIDLHRKFELDISKNGRDIAQLRKLKAKCIHYSWFHCIVCTADKMTSLHDFCSADYLTEKLQANRSQKN